MAHPLSCYGTIHVFMLMIYCTPGDKGHYKYCMLLWSYAMSKRSYMNQTVSSQIAHIITIRNGIF